MSEKFKRNLGLVSLIVGIGSVAFGVISTWSVHSYRLDQAEARFLAVEKNLASLESGFQQYREILIRIEERLKQVQEKMVVSK